MARHRRAGSRMRAIPGVLASALALLAILAAGCSPTSGSPLGFDKPPAGLDPNSPKLVAADVAFEATELHARASTPFILVFENRDKLPHNVSLYTDPELAKQRFNGKIFDGPATLWYPVPALIPGTYVFLCDLHPNMRGTLVAS